MTSVLLGLIAATYIGPAGPRRAKGAVPAAGGGFVATSMVACPVCSSFVAPYLAAGGALSFVTPYRPLIGLASVGLLGVTLWLRLRAQAHCRPRAQ